MPCLIDSGHTGTIAWLGRVPDRDASLRAEALDKVQATFDGLNGESHRGATRPACIRVNMLHDKGTEIRNTRQLSILSAAENAAIAAEIGLDTLNPIWLGASMVIDGIADFTHIPPGSRLQSSSGTTLTVDHENGPCNWPGKEIEADHPGHGKAFRKAAENRRGVVGWVERPGPLAVGDSVKLFIPAQRAWQPE